MTTDLAQGFNAEVKLHNPGCVSIKAPFSPRLQNVFKYVNGEPFPAYEWDSAARRWYLNRWHAKNIGLWQEAASERQVPPELTSMLYPHQLAGLKQLLDTGTLLAQWDTGCGKSLLALTAHKVIGGKTLIIAPRMVVQLTWPKEISQWCPEASVWFQAVGKAAPETQPDIAVVSVDSLNKIPPTWAFDFIVIDELHTMMHSTSARHGKVTALMDRFPQAYRLGLTATPYGTAWWNIQTQLNALTPHSWGSPSVWKDYFHVSDTGGYEGRKRYYELKPSRVTEFGKYIAPVTNIVTQAQIRHLFPQVTWKVHDQNTTPPTVPHGMAWPQAMQFVAPYREIPPVDPGKNTLYLTWFHKSAEAAQAITGLPVITGSTTPAKRAKLLATADNAICTIRCINEGIDLRRFTQVVLLETFPVPRYMLQVLGRFVRLGGKEDITFIVSRMLGTLDDVIIPRLVDRLAEQMSLSAPGDTVLAFKDILARQQSEEDFLRELHATLDGIADFDEAACMEDDDAGF